MQHERESYLIPFHQWKYMPVQPCVGGILSHVSHAHKDSTWSMPIALYPLLLIGKRSHETHNALLVIQIKRCTHLSENIRKAM